MGNEDLCCVGVGGGEAGVRSEFEDCREVFNTMKHDFTALESNHRLTIEIQCSHYKVIYQECELSCLRISHTALRSSISSTV